MDELLQLFMGHAGFRIGGLIRRLSGFFHPIFVHSIRLAFSLSFCGTSFFLSAIPLYFAVLRMVFAFLWCVFRCASCSVV